MPITVRVTVAVNVDIPLTGIRAIDLDLARRIASLRAAEPRIQADAMRAIGSEGLSVLRGLCPVVTGALRSSLAVRYSRDVITWAGTGSHAAYDDLIFKRYGMRSAMRNWIRRTGVKVGFRVVKKGADDAFLGRVRVVPVRI